MMTSVLYILVTSVTVLYLGISNVKGECNLQSLSVRVSSDRVQGNCLELPGLKCRDYGPDDTLLYSMVIEDQFAVTYNGDSIYLCLLKDLNDVIRKFKGNLTVLHTNGSIDTVRIVISSMEVNDPPVVKAFTATLPEDTAPGWSTKVQVSDPDSGLWGSLVVTPVGLPSEFHLRQDGLTTYRLVLDRTLDAERQNKYIFTIEALDGGGLLAEAEIKIFVTDVNDNKPTCLTSDTLRLSVTANLATPLMYLPDVCSDRDVSPANQIVSYKLTGISENCENGFILMSDNTVMVRRTPDPNQTYCFIHLAVSDLDFTTKVTFKISLVGCRASLDERGYYWGISWPGWTIMVNCPQGYSGTASRKCTEDSVYLEPIYRCTKNDIVIVQKEVEAISNGTGNATISKSLQTLAKVTSPTQVRLQEGDIRTVEDILNTIVNVSQSNRDIQQEDSDAFLDVASNLLDENNGVSWRALLQTDGTGADSLLEIIDTFVDTIKPGPQSLKREPSSDTLQFAKPSLVVQVGSSDFCEDRITFPATSHQGALPDWARSVTDTIRVTCRTASNSTSYSGTFYKNVSGIVSKRFQDNGEVTELLSNVMSFKLSPSPVVLLDPPVEMTFTISKDSSPDQIICGFWKMHQGNGSGAWSTEGCWLKSIQDKEVTCACNHLTNFAILMSPSHQQSPEHGYVLSLISISGCGVSMVCLMFTVALYTYFWKQVMSDRSTILMNLCCMLFLGYLVFLVGIKQTQPKGLCTAVAVSLHYIYLVVFFLMLVEGLDLFRSVAMVASSRHVGWKLIFPAWVVPAVIVAVSIGVTQLEGYGNDAFCWLSLEDGLFWAFAGPVVLVILVNVVITIFVLRQMFATSKMKAKTDIEKAKVGLRSICVLLPIMGVTWIIGLISVNQDTIAFQYAFAILNSLQGVFIFIFHCVMNRKIKDAIGQVISKRRRKALLGSEMNTFARSQDTLATLA